uniref:Uncharacterized protein n=1 Tax=Arundo donax TaxID=35708 RepID=A0A0A9BSH0_ARUDO
MTAQVGEIYNLGQKITAPLDMPTVVQVVCELVQDSQAKPD